MPEQAFDQMLLNYARAVSTNDTEAEQRWHGAILDFVVRKDRLIVRLQWGGYDWCPVCDASRQDGHEEWCEIGREITERSVER